MSVYRDFMVPWPTMSNYQYRFNGAPTLSILYMQRYCRDLIYGYGAPTMSVDRDFAEILWCPDYVNLQRFHGAPTMSIYRDFAEIPCCPDYVNLQRFHGAPTMSIYRDFAEISCCPDYVNLQRFHGAPTMSICRDFAEIL